MRDEGRADRQGLQVSKKAASPSQSQAQAGYSEGHALQMRGQSL